MKQRNFRGKRIDNGVWVDGFYLSLFDEQMNREVPTIVFQHMYQADMSYPYPSITTTFAEVDPKTIGQFTGQINCNDEEIYEYDIVKISLPLGGFWGKIKQEKIGVVKFEEDLGSYIVEWEYSKDQHHALFSEDVIYMCEKLGNIFDNPEILISKNE